MFVLNRNRESHPQLTKVSNAVGIKRRFADDNEFCSFMRIRSVRVFQQSANGFANAGPWRMCCFDLVEPV